MEGKCYMDEDEGETSVAQNCLLGSTCKTQSYKVNFG